MKCLPVLAISTLAFGCTTKVELHDTSWWNDPTQYPPMASGDAYYLTTNSGGDTLSWIEYMPGDAMHLKPVFEEPVGNIAAEREGPHHGASALDGSAYYIGLSNFVPGSGSGPHANHGNGTVDGYCLKYDSTTHELLASTHVDPNPGDVRLTPDGKYILQSHFDLALITRVATMGGTIEDMFSTTAIIDAATMQVQRKVPTCPAAHGLRPSADSKYAYVSCFGSDELAIIDLAAALASPIEAGTVNRTTYRPMKFQVGPGEIDPTNPIYEPYAVSVSPADGKVWVSCQKSDDVRIFDPATMTWDARGPIATGGSPFFGDFTADGATFLVPNQLSETLVLIDANAATAATMLKQTLVLGATCRSPHAVVVTPDQHNALVVCEGDHVAPGTVNVIGLGPTATVDDHYDVGVFPDDLILVRRP